MASFDNVHGAYPFAGLIVDADGNLFGTTNSGGSYGRGTVFEIAKTAAGYAGTPTTLVSFAGTDGSAPVAGLIADAAGNLFGTTPSGGASDAGVVFEIAKTAGGYASTPTTLASFGGALGANPQAGLILDANGNLFGTTMGGGAFGAGVVFEIVKTASGYAGTPTVLASLDATHGANPVAGLVADAAGNLFGTTFGGGAFGFGTVFEIAKTAGGWASTPTTLVSFDLGSPDGSTLQPGLILDANGNLFGMASASGAHGKGTVFEVANTTSGYASAPVILATFDGANGAGPYAALIADANGNLFGTTPQGGAYGQGTVFEITGSGFAVPAAPPVFAGTPGRLGCIVKSVAALTRQDGGIRGAVGSLGYAGLPALLRGIATYCRGA